MSIRCISKRSQFTYPLTAIAVLTQNVSTVYDELRASGKFEDMNLSVDEAEHSMEMHLPYLAKVFQG